MLDLSDKGTPMCEFGAVFSKAFVEWSPGVSASGAPLVAHRNFEAWAHVRARGFSGRPSEAEENEAAAILSPFMLEIEGRFGLDPVVAPRYALCSKAIEAGTPITALARALVEKLEA